MKNSVHPTNVSYCKVETKIRSPYCVDDIICTISTFALR